MIPTTALPLFEVAERVCRKCGVSKLPTEFYRRKDAA